MTNRHVLRALLVFVLGVALLQGAARAEGEGSTAPMPEPPHLPGGGAPPYQAHVLMPGDFGAPWPAAAREEAWAAGLPAPQVVRTANVFPPPDGRLWLPALFAPPQMETQIGAQPLPAARDGTAGAGDGWQTVYRQAPRAGIGPGDARAPCRLLAVAPELQFVCVFGGLQAARNLMVQFDLRLPGSGPGDTLFVGISTDGETFYGRRWRAATAYPEPAHPEQGGGQRLFAPFPGISRNTGGRVAVLWSVGRDRLRPHPQGMGLDELLVAAYFPRAEAVPCSRRDPAMSTPGAQGRSHVSKGLNLPPYPVLTPSGLAGHTGRLRQTGVQWVRLEWQAYMRGAAAGGLTGPAARLNYVDLRHYDELLALLCAPEGPIGVLGLLDYWTLPDQRWRNGGQADEAYVQALAASAGLLARLYADRVGAWEVWNEPDFLATRLAPGDYARLLVAVHGAIKQAAPAAQVVFGGLGGADWVAAAYFRQAVQALPPGAIPYDVFAIHPYPSHEFRRAGRIVRDPSYLHFAAPTILQPFLDTMRAAGHAPRPIWITELGWNRAADSDNPATLGCQAVYETMVTGSEQAAYLPQQFDILFNEVEWGPGEPAVAKIFWYQYMDVGIALDAAACRGRQAAGGAPQVVDWWFGLYSGTDWRAGIVEPQPNLVECSFRAYPDVAAIDRCLAPAHMAANTVPQP